MHVTIGIPPIIISMGIPMLIIFIIASQRSRIISIVTPSAGIILQTMPSLPISMVMRHPIGVPVPDIMFGIMPGIIIPGIIMLGIIPGIIMLGIIPDIMFGIIPDIMFGIIMFGIIPGIITPIMGIMFGIIPGIIGIRLPIGICMAGIMAVFSIWVPMNTPGFLPHARPGSQGSALSSISTDALMRTTDDFLL